MIWLKSNWRWAVLNLFAGSVFIIVLSRGGGDWNTVPNFDAGLEGGKWAIRFLLLCLTMTPLRTYFGWNRAIKLRKPAGLWSFGFGVVHVLYYISETQLTWLVWPMPTFIVLGLLGMLILATLAITSNRWAMRQLKKYWKRLHRLVYLSGLSVVFHAILATTASKKLFVYDPQAVRELNIYLGMLVVLLVVRIPQVRRGLKQIPLMLRHRHQVDVEVIPVTIPDSMPEYWPKMNGHEAGVLSDDFLTAVHREEKTPQIKLLYWN